MDGLQTRSSRKRRRPAKSCEPCRLRKIRCDLALPCAACKRARAPVNCTYRADDEADLAASSRETEPTLVRPGSSNGDALQKTMSPIKKGRANIPATSRSGNVSTESLTNDGLNSKNRILLLGEMGSSRSNTLYPTPRLRNAQDKTRLFGPSHWMYTAEALPSLLGKFDTTEVEFDLEEDDRGLQSTSDLINTHMQLRRIRRTVKGYGADDHRSMTALLGILPGMDVCKDLASQYFRLINPIYRIVHAPSFWQDFRHFELDQLSVPSVFVMQLALIISIGTSFILGQDETYLKAQSQNWIGFVQSWIIGPTTKSTHNIHGVQVYCLLLLSKQVTCNSSGLSWISSGSLMTMAMSMGLHRRPGIFPSLTPFQSDMRKRLWVVTLELYLQHHVDSSLPVLINTSDFELPEILNLNDEDINNDTETTPASKEGLTDASLQIQLTESLQLRLEVARLLNGMNNETSFERALDLGERLQTACRKMSNLLGPAQGQDARNNMAFRAFHRKFVDILVRKYVLLLLRPYMIKSQTNTNFHLARKVCVDSAKAIISHIDHASPSDDLVLLAAAGRGSFKGPFSLDVILVLGLEVFMLFQEAASSGGPSSWTDPLDVIHKESRDRVVEVLVKVHGRLLDLMRAGSVSSKMYNFLSAMLGQVNAMEEGRCAKTAVYESIGKSLNKTLEIFRERHPLESAPPAFSGTDFEFQEALSAFESNFMDWDISNLLYTPETSD